MNIINDYPKNSNWFGITIFITSLLLASLIYLFIACSKTQNCWDCEIKTTFHRNPEHFTDTLDYYDTTEIWCDIDPDEFEINNTDTIYVFFIDSLGTIVGFWGTQTKITKCK